LPPVQVPLWQVSVWVQALPSSHGVSFATFACAEHWPLAGSQVLAALHAVAAGHVIGVPGTHAPAWQLSPTVHALPSLHVVPLVTAMQAPVVAEQALQTPHAVPVSCQTPLPSHVCGCMPLHRFAVGVHDPVQAPPLQTNMHAAPVSFQAPVASQVCGCSTLHWREVGLHMPVQLPAPLQT
jgi:hypothetical protein